MRHIKQLYLLILILTFGTGLSLSQLQSRVDEIYFVRENTVFAWSPDVVLRQIGKPIPNLAGITLSPNGDHFLYSTSREEVTQILEAECPCGGPTPTGAEFWLMDAETGEQTLLVGQPETIADLGEVRDYGQAVWSTDGRKIAWVEGLEYSDLYVYDLSTRITTLVQKAIPSTELVSNIAGINRWTSTGIWFEYVIYDDDFAPIEDGYHIYDPAGGLVAEIPDYAQIASLLEVDTQLPLAYEYWNHFTVDDNGLDMFITHSLTGWQTVNVATGATAPLESGIIVQVAAAAPETSIRIHPSILSDEGRSFQEIYNNQGERITIHNGGFTLSRDGTFFISIGIDNTLMVTDNRGTSIPLDLPWDYDYSVGGHIAYRLERRTEHLWLTTHCVDSDLPFRFPFVRPDDENPMAHVLGTTANNLRDQPGITSTKIGSMEAGSSLEILEGPVCADDIAWWYVESLDMQRGWTAEGADNEYWLAPGCSVDYCEVEG
jgi:WD40 repeat protein